jgi:hypothetical protein
MNIAISPQRSIIAKSIIDLWGAWGLTSDSGITPRFPLRIPLKHQIQFTKELIVLRRFAGLDWRFFPKPANPAQHQIQYLQRFSQRFFQQIPEKTLAIHSRFGIITIFGLY